MRRFFFLFPLLALSFSAGAQVESYDIPQREIAVRDPFIAVDREAQRYYLVTTARDADGHVALQTFESPDLLHWRRLGINYQGNKGWMLNVRGKKDDLWAMDHWWAPDTYLYRGRYYTIITLTCEQEGRINFCTLLRGGKKPQANYENVLHKGVPVSLTPYGQQCLDGSLYIDQKGLPWLVYSLEWNGPDVQDRIGETWAIRLKKNLKGSMGEPIRLFRACEASWPTWKQGSPLVVDAPFLWRDEASGHLICLWSSFREGKYCVGQAISRSGSISGPWEHLPDPIYVNGGHEMLFRDLQGNLKMSLHHDNNNAHLRIVDVQLRDGKFLPVEE
ncbi:MAG: family 43 glycosylhydrolase [Bacteroidaceae bacterium]|nr:family 43 glycosylhydrolase [Bacteroidaceae bacterium]